MLLPLPVLSVCVSRKFRGSFASETSCFAGYRCIKTVIWTVFICLQDGYSPKRLFFPLRICREICSSYSYGIFYKIYWGRNKTEGKFVVLSAYPPRSEGFPSAQSSQRTVERSFRGLFAPKLQAIKRHVCLLLFRPFSLQRKKFVDSKIFVGYNINIENEEKYLYIKERMD